MNSVEIVDQGGGRFEVRGDRACLIVDRPDGESGEGGFRPVELLMAALGACTAGTIRSFAIAQGVGGFEGVDIEVTCEVMDKPERVGSFAVRLRLRGEVADRDAARLARIGAHCKIHNTLRSLPATELEVVAPPARAKAQ